MFSRTKTILLILTQLKHGADPNARYFMGSEINLVNVLKIPCIKLLLQYGAQPDSRDRAGLTPLMKAARHPHGYATVKLLIEYGADVNDIAGERHDYRTVLHHSIFSGNVDLIRLLLTSGARYPLLDFDKPSPMDIAIISGRLDIAKLLIEFDADINRGSQSTIGQPLHTALTQRIENKKAIIRLLLDSGAEPNSRTTSSRNTGPPLHDYLHSTRRFGGTLASSAGVRSSESQVSAAHTAASLDLEIVRMMLMYGARVILKTPAQHPLGLVRTLERIHEELSLELLHLLIGAAEDIDWYMMSKVIYSCLRHTNRSRTNELFDPSVVAEITPERLRQVLSDKSAHHQGVSESIIKLMNGGKGASAVMSLKQVTRIRIRNIIMLQRAKKGHKLIEALKSLPIPMVLTKYLLYLD